MLARASITLNEKTLHPPHQKRKDAPSLDRRFSGSVSSAMAMYEQDIEQATELPEINNHGEEISGSEDEGSQFSGQKRKNHDRDSGKKQKQREVSQR